MSSQIDPRLNPPHSLPHPQHPQHPQHHQQQQQHHQIQNSQHYPPFTPPLQRLPNIQHFHGLPNHPDTLPPPQLPYYRQPPQPSPTAKLHHLVDHGPSLSPRAHDGYQDDASSPNGANLDSNDPKRSRACEACRGLKVRCDPNVDDPTASCKRCAKAKRQCVVTAPSRKRQKKTDGKVAELEKKVDALQAQLHAQGMDVPASAKSESGRHSPDGSAYAGTLSSLPSPDGSLRHTKWKQEQEPEPTVPPKIAGIKRRHSGEIQSKEKFMLPVRGAQSAANNVDGDTLLLGHTGIDSRIDAIIDRHIAARVFDRYIADMAPQFPAVVFDAGTKAADIRSTKPILFLAILVAASIGMTELTLQQQLAQLSLDIFADCIIRNGVKSLELVQALLVSCIWYRPPPRYEQMNFYQLTHIAAVMAIDVGMGKRLKHAWRVAVAQNDQVKPPRSMLLADTVEVRRTWLGCYFLCANTSMTLRRPSLIRWTGYMDECIDLLEKSTLALPSDKVLCEHIKLQRINEDVGLQFSMDDPSASINISDPKVQRSLKSFERSLEDWTEKKKVFNTTLQYNQHVTSLYMHEVAMHNNHNIDDFQAPFTEESLKAASSPSDVLSPTHSSALSKCLASVKGIFDTFFSFDIVTLKALPIFYFVRIAYALVALLKLFFAVTAPNSEVSKIITEESIRVEYHLDGLLALFDTIAAEDAFRPANKFLTILGKLREWFKARQLKGGSVPKAEPQQNQRPQQKQQQQQQQQQQQHQQNQQQHQQQQHQQHQQQMQLQAHHQQQQQHLFQQQQQHQQQQQQQQQQHHLQPRQPQPPSHALHHQPQQPLYNITPLHFLSEVATTNAQQSAPRMQPPPNNWYGAQPGQQQQQQMVGQQQQQGPMDATGPGADFDYMGVNSGFEQAMDMFGPGAADGDIANLFMDPMFDFVGLEGLGNGNAYPMGW